MGVMQKIQDGSIALDQEKKVFLLRGGAIAATVAVLGVSSPMIWSAFQGGAGLLGLGVVGVIGVGFIQMLPFLGQKFENKLLKLRKEEARMNPVEQLENRYLEKSRKLESSKNALAIIGTNISSMGRQLEDQARNDPGHDLTSARRSFNTMLSFYEVNVDRLKDAQHKLDDFRIAVNRKRFEYEFAQSGQVALEGLNDNQADEQIKELLSDEAVRSIETQFDQVFATMELDTILEQARKFRKNSGSSSAPFDAEFTTII